MRAVTIALVMGAVLALSGCQTDDQPVNSSPPVAPPSTQTPPPAPVATPATLAWANQAVTDALAAEKTARAAGSADSAVFQAVQGVVSTDLSNFVNGGAPFVQVVAGLTAAANDARNTPLTRQAFEDAKGYTIPQPVGSCPGCRGVHGG